MNMKLESTERARCHVCGSLNVIVQVWSATQAMYTLNAPGEIETVKLSNGYSVECPDCGYADAEPPQY